MTTRVRIATLNIWHDRGPWPDRLRLIRHELERLRPTALALQEVLRGPGPGGCQATAIAEGLGYEVAYGPATQTGDGRLFGNALLSREPIHESRTFQLPGADIAEPRSLLYALIATPQGDLPVFVTHLAWEFHHSPLRQEQTAHIAERIDELAPAGAVLMGDFNAEPHSPEIRFLRTVGFDDAWLVGGWGSSSWLRRGYPHRRESGGNTPGSTFDRANGFALEADEPNRRIDYVFVRGGEGQVVRTELAFTKAESGHESGELVWPSDHYGLVTDLSLKDPE